jgi:uncharacterized protein (TIGR03067 family)
MTTRLLLWLAVLVFPSLFPTSTDGREDTTNDEKIQGTWLPVTAELSGQPFPDEIRKSMKLVVKEHDYLVTVGSQPDAGTWKIDTGKMPKTMDITGTKGPNKGKTFLAIYELKGDTLRVCYDLSGKSRPSEFKTKPMTQLFLVLYERKKG